MKNNQINRDTVCLIANALDQPFCFQLLLKEEEKTDSFLGAEDAKQFPVFIESFLGKKKNLDTKWESAREGDLYLFSVKFEKTSVIVCSRKNKKKARILAVIYGMYHHLRQTMEENDLFINTLLLNLSSWFELYFPKEHGRSIKLAQSVFKPITLT